jgi:hypothetical protein
MAKTPRRQDNPAWLRKDQGAEPRQALRWEPGALNPEPDQRLHYHSYLRAVKPRKHAHQLVYQTAWEMAAAVFDDVMKDDKKLALWKELTPDIQLGKSQRIYADLAWPHFAEQARATLAAMLDGHLPDDMKEQISDALEKDNAFRQFYNGPSVH